MKATADAAASTDAPLSEPVEGAIDLEHLARMTLGERSLEAEVLTLFERQAAVLLARMRVSAPAAAAALAHTLKGSARGIGAWRVAAAADAVEFYATRAAAGGLAGLVAKLSATVDETKAFIADRLRSHGPF
jgi:HPt (histidine-containing phosphotransfer) domain-containing protein